MRFIIIVIVLAAGCGPTVGGTGPVVPIAQARPRPTRPPTPLGEGLVQGQIDGTDEIDPAGRLSDFYTVRLETGARVRFWVQGGFDAMLEVFGPEGGSFYLSCDDFVPGLLDPVIEFEPPLRGEYLVRVSPLQAGAQGPYQVGLARIDPAQGSSFDSGGAASGAVAPGGAGPGIPVGAQYWLDVRSGERLRVRVTSTEFDTTATIVGPTGQVWANDDANDTGPDGSERPLDSTLVIVAPAAGRYHLVVSPYRGNGMGSYRIRSERHAPVVVVEGQAVPTMGYAGRQGEGRILGVFAGISDYGATRSPLFGCADDATLLAQAFREARLQGPDQQTILTDINANVAAMTAALQGLAATATERDVVVIFFSGHGDVETRAGGPEPTDLDGSDETIVLYDAEMTDNAMVALIDQINANTIILALDSCHSGGFASDFVTRPGRIGLFSSDEDVLSDVATSLLAGGYLSYALRRAVIGDADAMPRDGVLFAGELTDYLHGSFVQYQENINPPGSTQPRQWLVARRGSVGWSDLLWLYPRDPDGSLRPIPQIPLQSAPLQ
jgi:hypothetical protein